MHGCRCAPAAHSYAVGARVQVPHRIAKDARPPVRSLPLALVLAEPASRHQVRRVHRSGRPWVGRGVGVGAGEGEGEDGCGIPTEILSLLRTVSMPQ